MTNKTVFIDTYGCTANKNDSEILIGKLNAVGFKLSSLEVADYIIVNTCGVKAVTEERIISKLKELSRRNKPLIVVGCLTKINPKRIRETVPHFAAIIESAKTVDIANVIKDIENGKKNLIFKASERKPLACGVGFSYSPVIKILQISEGCLSNCSFCGTQIAKGKLRSFELSELINAAKAIVASGFREIHLTSQDCGAYGLDCGTNLAKLLKEITAKVAGKYFLRIGMANPTYVKTFVDELIEAFKHQNVFKFLHVPVQSGSDKVLADMKRGHSAADVINIVAKFRKAFPEIQIWTDIIVGYPTETEEYFRLSLELIEKIQPDYVNVSRFGARPGTAAAQLKPLKTEVLKDRSRRMSELCRAITLERNKKWLGWSGAVLVDEFNREKQNFVGRNFAYKPIVLRGKHQLGEILEIKIKNAGQVLFA